MRVLILSQFYAPEPIPKPHELAVGLTKLGHQVQVITGFPNYPLGSFYTGYRLRLRRTEIKDGVRILRLPLIPDHSNSSIRRILNYSSFMVTSSFFGPWSTGNADIMYVWHPPLTVGVSAWIIGLMRRIPFVYGVHDLWPDAVEATGMVKSRSVLKWLSRLEKFVYRRASTITVGSQGFKRNLLSKGVPAEKIHVLGDWGNEDIFRPVTPDEHLAEEMGMAGRFNVLFGGNMGLAQALETVVEAAQGFSHIPDIQMVFAGDGLEMPRLESLVKEKGLSNVRFLGRRPADQMPLLYALADVLLVHLKRDPLIEITIPSKVYNYLACQRPILVAGNGDAADLVKRSGAGVICSAEDPDALARSVIRLYDMSTDERAAMGAAGKHAFLQHYSRDILVRRHEELFVEMTQHTKRIKSVH